LETDFPEARLGPHGDTPKIYCVACQRGVFNPLYEFEMAKYHPEFGGMNSR
jgi:hypothetical protein